MAEMTLFPATTGLATLTGASPLSRNCWTGDPPAAVVVMTDCVSDVQQINELLGNHVFVLLTPQVPVAVRRVQAETGACAPDQEVVGVGHLEIDLGEHNVRWQGRRLDLSEHEIGILACLAESAGRAYSFIDLFRRVWGSSCHIDPAVVHSAIQRLRRKFAAARVTVTIESVRAYGFRLTCPSRIVPVARASVDASHATRRPHG
jgi:two-component system, OmpR family, response regulator MtrA